ncbi:TVP38/TMEM64 family protein [Alkalicoccobacillus murimartini]|uniref:TVP38/TMEM64 family membrane protein n=1 Tax=Alkalicoccobacillus murimartini TaxID=171685 RepID=A0ABT9YJP8_9BACI|nr:VTT domain-containing protein [Alkalicoccobacillus murimartini]MDQ0208073.1 putative membrane protein YdjX (TVP38/TMEM64 family) [Alkalicoccobacillus murimartini]
MEDFVDPLLQFIEQAGWLGPFFFILFHLVRQVLFIPVLLICLAGGFIFGGVLGSLYSFIGLMGSSISFYFLMKYIPWLHKRLARLKERVLKKDPDLNVWQLSVFRLVPFVHFHVLSFYVMEKSADFKGYVRQSFIMNIPMAIVYTTFGNLLYDLNPYGLFALASFLILLMIISRNWSDQAVTR